jgi:periplasmic divalent cation tolerance protein
MPDIILVQTSINSKEAAHEIARAVIEKRLAATCWIQGPMTSTAWWYGRIMEGQEWICTFKTRKELYNDLEQLIKEVHLYKIPDIVAIPVLAANPTFLEWVEQETKEES